MSTDTTQFDVYGKLPAELQGAAKNVQRFAGYFLVLDKNHKPPEYYDWEWLKSSVDQLPATDLTIEEYDSQSVHQQQRTVETMLDLVVELLVKIAKATVTEDYKAAMKEKIKATFTNLREDLVGEGGMFTFYKETESNNSSFTYRIVFAHPNPDVPNDFYAMVTTIRLNADIRDKSTWWGLKHTTTQNFSADLTCMKLVCSKDYKAGPKPTRA